MRKITVALSGGVDSAVAALLLKKKGYKVHGVFMQNWEVDNDDPYCSTEQDLLDAKEVADHIGIPIETVNFSREYWKQVFQHCLDEFSAGRTANPDVLCNREIKFKTLLDYTLSRGDDGLATGHYVRKQKLNNQIALLRGKDNLKDQSYFLYMLTQKALKHALFPLGELKKTEVRKIAASNGLPNAYKKDSTGICFIGERKFSTFLNEFMLKKPGNIETIEGKVVGKHNGLMFYTLGQRKGLKIGGLKDASAQAWYVIRKDLKKNILVVGQGHDNSFLFSNRLIGDGLHWHSKHGPKLPYSCTAKTRYQQKDEKCSIKQCYSKKIEVLFNQPIRAITPGQSIVFYDGEICLGGAIIE